MTGAVMAAAGAAAAAETVVSYSVSIGNTGAGPGNSNAGTFRGATLGVIDIVDPDTFQLSLSADVTQSQFKRVIVEDANGEFTTFLSSAATFTAWNGSLTRWNWSPGTFAGWTVSTTRTVMLAY